MGKAAGTVTLATLLGAAAGYLVADAVGQDGRVGAVIGAVAAGSVSAAIAYSNYLLDKANNDRLLAMDLMHAALVEDIDFHRRLYADVNAKAQSALTSARTISERQFDKSRSLAQDADTLSEVGEELGDIKVGSRTYAAAGQTYPEAAQHIADRRTDAPMTAKRNLIIKDSVILVGEAKSQISRNMEYVQQLYQRGIYTVPADELA